MANRIVPNHRVGFRPLGGQRQVYQVDTASARDTAILALPVFPQAKCSVGTGHTTSSYNAGRVHSTTASAPKDSRAIASERGQQINEVLFSVGVGRDQNEGHPQLPAQQIRHTDVMNCQKSAQIIMAIRCTSGIWRI